MIMIIVIVSRRWFNTQYNHRYGHIMLTNKQAKKKNKMIRTIAQ